MTAITTALRNIRKMGIPNKILELAFLAKTKAYRINTNLDKQITDLVITPVVLSDCNIVGGVTYTIDINKCGLTRYNNNNDNTNVIITIPNEVVNNRKVMQALSLTANLTYDNISNTSDNPILNAAQSVYTRSNQVPPGEIYTGLKLISRNTILIEEDIFDVRSGYLEVVLENNANLSNISTRSFSAFTKLVSLAVKAYIYNELVLELEEGSLYYGHNLSKLASIVDGYESAYEEYTEYLNTTWAKVSNINDSTYMDEHISLLTPGTTT